MSTQPGSILLGPRIGTAVDDPAASDLQQVLSRVLAVLGRRWWLFVIPLLTGMLISLIVGLLLPRQYRLTTLFERRDDEITSKIINKNCSYSFEALRQSLAVDIKGYGAVATVVEELNLTQRLPRDAGGNLTAEGRKQKQAMVADFASEISVSLKEKGPYLDLIELSYLGDQPEIGAEVINRLRDNYIAFTRGKVNKILEEAHTVFSEKVDQRQQEVIDIRTDLIDIEAEHPGTSPEARNLLDDLLNNERLELERLQRDREKTQTQITAREELLDQLRRPGEADSSPASRPASVLINQVANPRYSQLAAEIKKTNDQLAEERFIKKKLDEHPDVKDLRRKLQMLHAELETQPEFVAKNTSILPGGKSASPEMVEASLRESQRRQVEADLKSDREIQARIDVDITKHRDKLAYLEQEKKTLPERRQAYMRLEQKLRTAENDLQFWKTETVKIARAMSADSDNRIQFTSLENARGPGQLDSPTLLGVLLLSAGIGLAFGVVAVFLREVLDRSSRDPARLGQKLGIPVLETIGELRTGRSAGWYLQHRVLPAVASVELMMVLGSGLLVYLSLEKPVLYNSLMAQSSRLWFG